MPIIPMTNKYQKDEVLNFDYIFHKYQYWVWAQACSATQDSQLREDIMQSIFLKYPDSPKKFPHEGAAFNWLKKVTRSTITDIMRKENTYKDRIKLEEDEVIAAYENFIPTGPLDDLVKKEASMEVRQFVKKLKPIHRDVIDMYYFEDLTVKEISEKLHVPQDTIYSRLSKARAILYDIIGDSIKDYYTE